jgi:hypothetical protein
MGEGGGLVLVRRGSVPPAGDGEAVSCCADLSGIAGGARRDAPEGTRSEPGIVLAGYGLPDSVLGRGELLQIRTAWKVARPSPYPFEVELRLVLDPLAAPPAAGGREEAGAADSRPAPSVLARVRRSLEERRTGTLRHLRERWRPCDRAHPTPLWREGEEHADRRSLRIPDAFEPGRYVVWISSRRVEMAPNADLGEWLTDALPESAVRLGVVTIR